MYSAVYCCTEYTVYCIYCTVYSTSTLLYVQNTHVIQYRMGVQRAAERYSVVQLYIFSVQSTVMWYFALHTEREYYRVLYMMIILYHTTGTVWYRACTAVVRIPEKR